MTTVPGVATETPLRARVAEEIRVALTRRRMSAARLGRELGVSQTYIWRRLNGETAFDIDDLERIARILGLRVLDLIPTDPNEGDTEHKFDFAPAPVRPRDNRPARGPRKGGDRDQPRRPARIRNVLTSSDLRSAA